MENCLQLYQKHHCKFKIRKKKRKKIKKKLIKFNNNNLKIINLILKMKSRKIQKLLKWIKMIILKNFVYNFGIFCYKKIKQLLRRK